MRQEPSRVSTNMPKDAPCLTVDYAITQRTDGMAGGNTTLALMLLVMTNTIAVFIAPFLIKAMLASQAAGVKLDSAHLLINLVITVLAPSIVGKARDPSYHRCLCCTSLSFQPLVRWGLKLIQKTP